MLAYWGMLLVARRSCRVPGNPSLSQMGTGGLGRTRFPILAFWSAFKSINKVLSYLISNSNTPTWGVALEVGMCEEAAMFRTCLSSCARAFSLSFSLPSVPRSLTSSSCSRLCCLWSRASSPMAAPVPLSPVLPSRDNECHSRPAVGAVDPSCHTHSSRMESCLMTAP